MSPVIKRDIWHGGALRVEQRLDSGARSQYSQSSPGRFKKSQILVISRLGDHAASAKRHMVMRLSAPSSWSS